MLIHLQRTRPARVITVVAVLCFVWIWLSNFQGVNLAQDLLPSYQRTVPDLGASTGTKTSATNAHQRSRIGKVTVAANKLDSDTITRALLSHERHNERHGYIHFIAKNQAVSSLIENDRYHRPKGAWTKPAYLLSIIVAELQKPEDERLEWVYWFDADTLVLNTETPLEVFLPPQNSTELSTIDLIITTNWDGLNSGVFALRVSPWSASLLSAVLAYPVYEATRLSKDRFRDQSAFQFLLEGKESPLVETPMASRDRWAKVPMRWFNSLPVNNAFYKNGTWIFGKNMTEGLFDNGTTEVYDDGHGGKVNPWKVMQGDMIVHFAGTSAVRDSWMRPWIERAEAMLPEWNNATTKYVLQEEAAQFWENHEKQLVIDRAKSKIEEAEKEKARKEKEKEEKKAKEERENKEKERIEKERLEKERKVEEKKKKKEAAVTAIPKVLTKAPKPTVVPKPAPPPPPAPVKVNATASQNETASGPAQLR